MRPIIRVQNLSKKYTLGGSSSAYSTIRETLMDVARRPLAAFRRNGRDPTIWALKDLDFEIGQGETVGIIGRNGAGKSTLLKILSRITDPTTGRAELYGRVASLLEVGTGFHPELSGRENIFLNGSILGMSRKEIENKFDEIVSFAEVEKFIDTPVKRYSSGMYVRLAFAVAAHLEPEIMVVDEVLAVGDVSFQKKCLGKMSEVAKEGRTVLFVSHNMGSVGRLCQTGFVLESGRMVARGSISEAISAYTQGAASNTAEVTFAADSGKKLQFNRARLLDNAGRVASELDRTKPFSIEVEYEVRTKIDGIHAGIMLDRIDGTPICYATDLDSGQEAMADRVPGIYQANIEFPGNLLNAGVYQIRLGLARYGGTVYDYCEPFVFTLEDHGTFASTGSEGHQRPGVLAIPLNWNTSKIA